ncbi:MAG: lactonase family protein, partial [Spirochaetales bacterium]|nr:lactonase family protein [Spirochaetales bacterium]
SSTLHLIAHTKTEKEPRNFTFSPDGCHILVANGSSNSVCVHRIAARTGIPRPCSNRLRIEQPVCLTFL